MKSKLVTRTLLWSWLGLFTVLAGHAQTVRSETSALSLRVLRTTEMRIDKLAAAPVLQGVTTGAAVRLVSLEGGWALVQASDKSGNPITGWVRASAVNLATNSDALSLLPSGRLEAGNTALTLGVRSLPARANRHALIVGLSRYADPATPRLPGARIDKQSATQMAQAMQVPLGSILYLQDEQATGDNIRQALRDLNEKVQEGDRVFIHFSGHGTRYSDQAAGGCVEALLTYEGGQSGVITNHEMADLLKNITQKTDKLFVMYDACYSGGVVQAASSVRTRGFSNASDEGMLRPKFANISEECGRPVNIKTRSLLAATSGTGTLPQDIIHVSAARDNEISFDDEQKGGLATQYVRDCMLREAKDTDNSGAISMAEITQCAQIKINQRMAGDPNFQAHHLTLNGNADFVPAWFSQSSVVATTPQKVPDAAIAGASKPPTGSTAAVITAQLAAVAATPTPVTAPITSPNQLTGEQALRQMFDQRDAKRRVEVTPGSSQLKIGRDALDLAIQSDRAGYVYVALVGSDNQSVYMLFPNDLDHDNHIDAGQKLLLPRQNWRVKVGGPTGTDHMLVMVADAPRDLRALRANKAGLFVSSLNDAQGRTQLGALLTASSSGAEPDCFDPAKRRTKFLCSDAFGAVMLTVREVQ